MRELRNYHLKDQYPANGLTAPADMTYVRILGIIAVLILVVACLNFMNLTNARGSGRLLEVGVRKVFGAGRKQLIGQFLAEAIFMGLLSLAIGIILINLTLPCVSEITGFPLQIDWLNPGIIIPLIGIAVITGILAGLYPSLLLTRLRAVETFKSKFKTGGNNLVTKGSLVFQFALSIGLLSCTLIMFRQQQYIKNHNLGFNQEEIIVIPTQNSRNEAAQSQRLVQQFKAEILSDPSILQACGVSNSFNKGNMAIFVKEEDTQVPVFIYHIDPDYIPLLDIELSEGQNFTPEMDPENDRSILVNEAFVRHFELEAPVGNYRLPEQFGDLANARIIGVVKDYNYMHLKSEIRPLVLQRKADALFGDILVKIKPEEVDKTIAQLRSNWQKINPAKPFEFSFLDEDLQKQYQTEKRWSKAISGATLLAVLIACLGLFGLIALILTERTKEIGIRKILGASIPNITWLISRQFVVLLGIAALAAMQNPVETLRYE